MTKMRMRVDFESITLNDFKKTFYIDKVPCSVEKDEKVTLLYTANAEDVDVFKKISSSITYSKISLSYALAWIAVIIKLYNLDDFTSHWNKDEIYSVCYDIFSQNIHDKRFKMSYRDEQDFIHTFEKNIPPIYRELCKYIPRLQKLPDVIFTNAFEFVCGVFIYKKWKMLGEATRANRNKIMLIHGIAGTGKSYVSRMILDKIKKKHTDNKGYDVIVSSLACKRICEFAKDLHDSNLVDSDTEVRQCSFTKLGWEIITGSPLYHEDDTVKIAIVEEASMLDVTQINTIINLIEQSDYVILNGDSICQHNSFIALGDLFMAMISVLSGKDDYLYMDDIDIDEICIDDLLGRVMVMTKPYRPVTEDAKASFQYAYSLIQGAINNSVNHVFTTECSPAFFKSYIGHFTSDFYISDVIDYLSIELRNDAILTIDNETVDNITERIVCKSIENKSDVWRHMYIRNVTEELYRREPVVIEKVMYSSDSGRLHIFVRSELRPDKHDCIDITDYVCNGDERDESDYIINIVQSHKLRKHMIHQNVCTIFSSQGNTYDNVAIYVPYKGKYTTRLDLRSLYVALTRHREHLCIRIEQSIYVMYEDADNRIYSLI